jgi:PAS domain S-box-containing protein
MGTKQYNILLVEDEVIIAMMEKRELEIYGYNVIIVISGEQAIDLVCVKKEHIDLILMDIDLGNGIDGTEAAREILKNYNIPILFLSSHTEKEVVQKVEKITSYGYVVKNSGIIILDASIKMAFRLFEANKKTENQKEHLRTILKSIGDAVIATDTSGKITQMNPVAEKLTGYKFEEVEGRQINEVFKIAGNKEQKLYKNPVELVLSSGKIVGLANHTILISKDGTGYQIADSGSPILDSEGNITGVVLVFRDITKEYIIQNKIKESEERLTRAEVASGSGNWELFFDSMTIVVSEGFKKIYGLDKDQYNFEFINNICMPEYRNELDAAKKRLIEKNEPYNVEFRIKTVDTDEIKYIHSQAVFNNENRILFGVIQDITGRKKIEIEQFRLLNIIEKSLNEVYIFDAETLKFEYLNQGALNNIGYTIDEMKNKTAFNIKPEFTDKTFREKIKPLINGEKEKLIFTTFHRRKNGTDYPVYVHLQLFKQDDKNVFFAIINDITDFKRAEEEINYKTMLLEAQLESSIDGILIVDSHGKKILQNRRSIEILKLPEDIAGNIDDSFQLQYFMKMTKNPEAFFEKVTYLYNHPEETSRDEVEMTDGTVLDRYSAPLPGKDGNYYGRIWIFHDITEHKTSEYNVKRLLHEKELILKEIHHRVKNNMSIISSLLKLQADVQTDETTRNVLHDAVARVQSMNLLYNKLYRSGQNTVVSVKEYFPVLIDEIAAIFPQRNTVKIKTEIEDFSLTENIIRPIGIIINELITNSMKYAFTGLDDCIIKVSAVKEDNRISIIYEDNGVGIPESVSFENSTGFGFQLIGMLIIQIKGTITVERDKWTRFIINFEL